MEGGEEVWRGVKKCGGEEVWREVKKCGER